MFPYIIGAWKALQDWPHQATVDTAKSAAVLQLVEMKFGPMLLDCHDAI